MASLFKFIFLFLLSTSICADSFTIYLVRHAEKADSKTPLINKDPVLTELGKHRANNLAMLLQSTSLQVIYSTDYQRTQQTAKPTAKQFNLPVISYDPRQLKAFSQQLLQKKQTALVIGHSNTTPQLVKLLGGSANSIDELAYGDLYQLNFRVHSKGISKPIQQHLKIPPQKLVKSKPLALEKIQIPDQETTFDMIFRDQPVGVYIQKIARKNRLLEITEVTQVDNLGINSTTQIAVDGETFYPKYLVTSGKMANQKADIKLQFLPAKNQVVGHSQINRQPFKPQGLIHISQNLPATIYERQSILALLPRAPLMSDQTFEWYNSFDNEIRQIHYDNVGSAEIEINGVPTKVNKIAITGGAPSQLFYVTPDTRSVVRIDIIGTPWTYLKR